MNIRIVELYKHYFNNNSFAIYLTKKNIAFDSFWFLNNNKGFKFLGKPAIIAQEIKCFFKLIINNRGFRNKKNLALGGHYSLFFITKVFGFLLGSKYHLYIYNFYLHGAGKKKIIQKIMHFLLNSKHTTLIVQSPDEVKFYEPLSKNKVYFIPFCEDPFFKIDNSKVPEGNYLFTGGYTNRDYALIVKCALLHPSIKFVIVLSKLNKEIDRKNLPLNIALFEEIKIDVFNGLMYHSIGVIIPLKENVGSSGQMLCLGAMKMSKPIIYCNISAINYYFNDNNCGFPYEMGDLTSLNNSVDKLILNSGKDNLMGKRAFKHFTDNYTLDKRNENLFKILNT